MPIYEYRCADCGKTFDALQKFSDEPYTNCGQSSSLVCETKGKGTVTRLISSPSFHLKGTGWYATDYAKSGASKPANTASGDSKPESKSEAKPESKSESKSESKNDSSSSASATAPAAPAKKD